jgi:hypothetical protein
VCAGLSAAAGRQLNERAGIPARRIVEAIAMASDHVDEPIKYSRPQKSSQINIIANTVHKRLGVAVTITECNGQSVINWCNLRISMLLW